MDSSEREHGPAIQRIFLEFQAGKMTMDEKQVVPDPRKGLVRVGKDEEGLVHVMWLDLKSDGIEDDQIVFPEEATYEKVGPPSARAYILKFRTDDRKLFFWMQERNAEGDSEICASVNFYINQPLEFPDEEEEPAAPVTLQHHEAIAEDDISSRAGNLAGPIIGAEVAGNITASGPVKMSDLQRILSNIGSSGEAVDPDAGIGLGDILKPELIFPLFETLRLEQQLESYLPEGHWTPEELMELVQSPPFRQQLDSFTYVLRTGQIDLTQFGIDPSKYKFTVPSFLEALEDSVSKSSETGESQTYKQTDRMDEGQ